MKRFVLPLLAALLMGTVASSCKKDVPEPISFNSSEARILECEVVTGDWAFSATDGWYYKQAWDAIDSYTMDYGTVNTFLCVTKGGVETQYQLPYIFTQELPDASNNTVFQPRTVSFALEEGYVKYMVNDIGEWYDQVNQPPTLYFRTVVNYPVTYTTK